MRDDALRQLLATNPHSPGTIRAFAPLRNVDAWYEAFGVKEGDKSYIKPEDRVRIWELRPFSGPNAGALPGVFFLSK
jgi:putative endopeptidase